MKTVDDYLANFSGPVRERLEQMRATILAAAPQATETISYGMPAYSYHGKPLIYFAGYSKHVGLYATPNGHEHFKAEFAPYKQGKDSVQFPNDQPLPLDLVRAVVAFRLDNLNK